MPNTNWKKEDNTHISDIFFRILEELCRNTVL